jgi:hypothetical protein
MQPQQQPTPLPRGLKKQIFGTVLILIALFNLFLQPAPGEGVDTLDIITAAVGVGFIILGIYQKSPRSNSTGA